MRVRMVWRTTRSVPPADVHGQRLSLARPTPPTSRPPSAPRDVQEIAAILDAEVGISGESVVERVREGSARTSTAI